MTQKLPATSSPRHTCLLDWSRLALGHKLRFRADAADEERGEGPPQVCAPGEAGGVRVDGGRDSPRPRSHSPPPPFPRRPITLISACFSSTLCFPGLATSGRAHRGTNHCTPDPKLATGPQCMIVHVHQAAFTWLVLARGQELGMCARTSILLEAAGSIMASTGNYICRGFCDSAVRNCQFSVHGGRYENS